MAELRVAREADDQIRAIEGWWSQNRPAAPLLFAHELSSALDLLMRTPAIGATYPGTGRRAIRRVLLARSRYHVYFSYDAEVDLVEVRAVWHASRGSGPSLM